MNYPEKSLAFGGSWIEASYQRWYSEQQFFPMPLPITNTFHSHKTDVNIQLLSSAHGQESLMGVTHKRGSPGRTESYSLQIAGEFDGPYYFGTPLQLSDTQEDADGKIRPTSPHAPTNSKGLNVLANGPFSPLSKNGMAFRHGNIKLRPSVPTGAFQPTMDDFPGASPIQATGVQQPRQEIHANAWMQQTPDRSGSPPDLDTYSCTYHGCTQRFGRTVDLNIHRRNEHRRTAAGQDEEARVSAVAVHKCKRINPSTGQPCNTTFSRPYDFTRHERTIHNSGRQKIRCLLCQEENTFSRNDALTRHMRVVHPVSQQAEKRRN